MRGLKRLVYMCAPFIFAALSTIYFVGCDCTTRTPERDEELAQALRKEFYPLNAYVIFDEDNGTTLYTKRGDVIILALTCDDLVNGHYQWASVNQYASNTCRPGNNNPMHKKCGAVWRGFIVFKVESAGKETLLFRQRNSSGAELKRTFSIQVNVSG